MFRPSHRRARTEREAASSAARGLRVKVDRDGGTTAGHAMGRHLPGTRYHTTAPQRPRPYLEPALRHRPAADGRLVRAMRIAETGRSAPHPLTQGPQPQGGRAIRPNGPGGWQHAAARPSPPAANAAGHPQRKPSTATAVPPVPCKAARARRSRPSSGRPANHGERPRTKGENPRTPDPGGSIRRAGFRYPFTPMTVGI
jgi:hypothetical protein